PGTARTRKNSGNTLPFRVQSVPYLVRQGVSGFCSPRPCGGGAGGCGAGRHATSRRPPGGPGVLGPTWDNGQPRPTPGHGPPAAGRAPRVWVGAQCNPFFAAAPPAPCPPRPGRGEKDSIHRIVNQRPVPTRGEDLGHRGPRTRGSDCPVSFSFSGTISA